jgi:hypothetical protein
VVIDDQPALAVAAEHDGHATILPLLDGTEVARSDWRAVTFLDCPRLRGRAIRLPRVLEEPIMLSLLARTRGAVLIAVLTPAAALAQGIDVWTVGVDNTRQGWNRVETQLTPVTVPKLRKTREFPVDEKIDVSPLVVADKLYVFTMSNTAFIFDVDSGAELHRRQLAPPFDPADIANPRERGMDLHNIYRSWGITATPVIDVETGTLYVTTFGKPDATSPNIERNNMLWILDAGTLADKQPPLLIAGDADNGGGGISNGVTVPYQKMRSGLGLLKDAAGNKAVIISFSINGEHPEGPGHGFVAAYDVRGLNREAGFTPTPALWNVTPDGGAGGIWMSGSGPAIEGSNIFLATGNGMDPGKKAGNFGESFVKLRYTPGTAGVNNGKPKLEVADFWGAFSDFTRADTDQDLGAAGVFIVPEHGNLIGGGKDGVLYNLNKDDLGHDKWDPQFNLPFVATYLPDLPRNDAGLPTTTAANANWPIVKLDRNTPAQTPTGKSHHIHGTPVYLGRATTGIIYLWGENERLKAYNFTFATKQITGFRAEGTQIASGNMAAPGGMPGGRLVVSSNGTTPNTGVIWGVYPTLGNANADIVHGALVAYDATAVVNGKLKQLFHSDAAPANDLGAFAKYATPVVANGKVYVATFSNKVVQYGLGGASGNTPAITSAAPSAGGGAGLARSNAPSSRATPASPAADATAAVTEGLDDLEKATFACSRAALNAAAREAATHPSKGTYQFSYFTIVNDSHHAAYEVHFASNDATEPVLKYCISIYCQQGFDPATAKASVALMGAKPVAHAAPSGHAADACSPPRPSSPRRRTTP